MSAHTPGKKPTPHTCDPEDRENGQVDADCLRCQETVANWDRDQDVKTTDADWRVEENNG